MCIRFGELKAIIYIQFVVHIIQALGRFCVRPQLTLQPHIFNAIFPSHALWNALFHTWEISFAKMPSYMYSGGSWRGFATSSYVWKLFPMQFLPNILIFFFFSSFVNTHICIKICFCFEGVNNGVSKWCTKKKHLYHHRCTFLGDNLKPLFDISTSFLQCLARDCVCLSMRFWNCNCFFL